MEKTAIVILNYLNYQDTIECVESIAADVYSEREIVIVENGSSNESAQILRDRFRQTKHVHLLCSETNEGFARGNNIGIRYARQDLGCSFVLLVNNDTIFKDPQLLTRLMEAYEPGVGVIGPRIISADGAEQNPVKTDRVRGTAHQAVYYWKKIFGIVGKQHPLYKRWQAFKGTKYEGGLRPNRLSAAPQCSLDLVLHGSCMLLTKDYFKYYPYLMPKTFLYFEENILTILTRKVGLTKKYTNLAYIYHKEDQSSEMSFGNNPAVKNKYLIASIKIANSIYPLSYHRIRRDFFPADNS